MKTFIDREPELALIREAVDTLIDKQRLLRTPIVEFYGVEGIGKTTLLNKIAEQCQSQHLNYFWADGGSHLLPRIVQEARKLLQGKRPVVVLMDGLDAAIEETFHEVEASLTDLAENSQVFIVLASKRLERFENSRTITRELTLYHLEPFDRESCREYLNATAGELSAEIRETIFEWTRGYPLAMEVLVEAVSQLKLDIAKPQDQKLLVSILTESVLQQSILSRVQPSELSWYQTILSLLSVPRRFNLVMMQDIIEKYAPDLKLSSSLAYITLPNKINRETSVLSWNMERAGYSVEGPVRNLFLLKLRIERPEAFRDMHAFLAEINQLFAQEVSGSDRIRYMREYLYHIANSEKSKDRLRAILEKEIAQITESSLVEDLLQFYEEFLQDEDLQNALGEANTIILTMLRENLENIYRRLALESSGRERRNYLRELLILTIGKEREDIITMLEQLLGQIVQKEPGAITEKLYNEVAGDEELSRLLKRDFDAVKAVFHRFLVQER